MLSHEATQGLSKSDDNLVIRALVTQVRQDFPAASAALEKLIALQGHADQAVTWDQWVRVLRWMGDDAHAMTVAAQGLVTCPKDAQLQQEFSALKHVGVVKPAFKVA